MRLTAIYREALALCDPTSLVRLRLEQASEREWLHRPCIVLGKAAERLAAGLVQGGWDGKGLAIAPSGYADASAFPPSIPTIFGSHPVPDPSSFEAGEELIRFAGSLREPTTVLISGGASATVEAPLSSHFTRKEIAEIHRLLLRSGMSIEEINVVRKHVSALKGGRLARMLPAGSRCWVLSDVTPGREEAVGSGPTFADTSTNADAAALLERLHGSLASRLAERLRSSGVPDTPSEGDLPFEVLADNDTFVDAAMQIAKSKGLPATRLGDQLEGDVAEVAVKLLGRFGGMQLGEILVAGGEPTVRVRGEGKGGRCSELAARILLGAAERRSPPFHALVASSDGQDGNSGAAGYEFAWSGEAQWSRDDIEQALGRSDAHTVLAAIGEPIIMGRTGNNLRDLIMMARP